MARRNVYLTQSFDELALDAVRTAHDQFEVLMSMPVVDRIKAAKDLPEIFTEAIVIAFNKNSQMARDRLRSHFYVNHIIDVNRRFTQASRRIGKCIAQAFINISTYSLKRITLFASARKHIESIREAFKGISAPIETRSLSVEIDLMLNTIRPAHAPTAAISAATRSI
jgi:hypothetical protein